MSTKNTQDRVLEYFEGLSEPVLLAHIAAALDRIADLLESITSTPKATKKRIVLRGRR